MGVSLFVCGDICNLIGGEFIHSTLADIIKSADYAVCNFEGVESEGKKWPYPHQNPGTTKYLKNNGFNLFLLANNHITDGGKEGLWYTLNTLTKNNVDYLGAGFSETEVYRPLIKIIGDYSFGFVNLCEAQVGQFTSKSCDYGYAWIGHKSVMNTILSLRPKVDFLVCFVHYGLEHFEVPLRIIRDYYHNMVDLGVDCIIGAHPHIAQGYEYYNNSLIIYSLGNFLFPRRTGIYEDENHSYSVILKFEKNYNIEINPVFHVLENNMVRKDDSQFIDLDKLNLYLGKDYDKYERDTVNEAYNKLCCRMLKDSTCGMANHINVKEMLKDCLRYTIFKHKYVVDTEQQRLKTLVRLYENEVYRYIIINALKEKIK